MPQGTVEVILIEGHDLKNLETFGKFGSFSSYIYSCVYVCESDKQRRVANRVSMNRKQSKERNRK
jgi:hypothetical protein